MTKSPLSLCFVFHTSFPLHWQINSSIFLIDQHHQLRTAQPSPRLTPPLTMSTHPEPFDISITIMLTDIRTDKRGGTKPTLDMETFVPVTPTSLELGNVRAIARGTNDNFHIACAHMAWIRGSTTSAQMHEAIIALSVAVEKKKKKITSETAGPQPVPQVKVWPWTTVRDLEKEGTHIATMSAGGAPKLAEFVPTGRERTAFDALLGGGRGVMDFVYLLVANMREVLDLGELEEVLELAKKGHEVEKAKKEGKA
ncbi:hypothetical protein BDZ85DRAFT_313615 [Elsinoe ampelina]|uniref:Uncharacterized protein n=1 Tax=Elsinoe ampelina TaxID=302913 RepID=A0A6A6GA62_9PEZI|nr:hypothetical protein BDZ85DRAFT_313615 [Elsinoe ampelina]